jgi:hypothetical protein
LFTLILFILVLKISLKTTSSVALSKPKEIFMQLQAVGNSNALSTALGNNPVQTLGMLTLTTLAMNILSNIPMAEARDEATKQACQIACDPLPGEKEDAPERICVATCEQGAEIVKTTTKEALKNGKWQTAKIIGKDVLGKVPGVVGGYLDCMSVCSPSAIGRVGGDLAYAAYNGLWNGDITEATKDLARGASKAGCASLLLTQAGYNGCMVCCEGLKLAGVG